MSATPAAGKPREGQVELTSTVARKSVYRILGVSEVAVIGLPHERWVEAVTAVIVLKTDHPLTPEAVIEHGKAHLAGFKVPKQVYFADSLPKSPSGKVLKRELRELYQR